MAETVLHCSSVTRACVYTFGIDTTPIPALCSTGVVFLLKHRINGERTMVVKCSAYVLCGSAEPSPSEEMAEVIYVCRER